MDYILRYWLPRDRLNRRRGRELIEYCRATGIRRVAFFSQSTELSVMPEKLEEARAAADSIATLQPRLAKIGVATDINLLAMTSQGDFGLDRSDTGWQMLVDVHGQRMKTSACVLDPGWRRYIVQLLGIFARIRPGVIWIDDDIREFWHQPGQWFCFCPLHLRRFKQVVGRSFSREKLVCELLRPGRPASPLRAQWLQMCGSITVEVATLLEQAVHQISPETRLGLMCSPVEQHAAAGRTWTELLEAVSGRHRPLTRPCMGCYTEPGPDNLLDGLNFMRQTLRVSSLPPSGTDGRNGAHRAVEAWPEIENYPYTRYNKSTRATACQIEMCAATGVGGVMLNLYDALGSPLTLEPCYQHMLLRLRPRLDQWSRMEPSTLTEQGVQLLLLPEAPARNRTFQGDYGELVTPRPWDRALAMLGFATTYQEQPVVALAGDQPLSLSPAECRRILSRGCLLDSRAAEAFGLAGHARLIGVKVGSILAGYHAEVAEDSAFHPPRSGMQDNWFNGSLIRELKPNRGARVISRMLSPQYSPLPGVVLFENAWGGRVAIYAHDGSKDTFGPSWCNPIRRAQVEHILRWVGRRATPVAVMEPRVLALRRDSPGRVLISLTNLCPDDLEGLDLRLGPLPRGLRQWRWMDGKGWRDLGPLPPPKREVVELHFPGPLAFQSTLFLDLYESAMR